MNKQIILNLPVKDLDKSKAFFAALGFTFNHRFSGKNAAFMNIVDGAIDAMLTAELFFQSLIDKPLAISMATCGIWSGRRRKPEAPNKPNKRNRPDQFFVRTWRTWFSSSLNEGRSVAEMTLRPNSTASAGA
ncbi:VOC family protein [Janthinobacterium sp. ROICE36]|uniref:VOC family protein n=1 Tax=Janthinobacterium sp. ROICE36 TaxID=2048670 RepID=UPI0021556765|nr:hypothetical protein [Janthinobacterium sp. ROICE36]